MAVAGGPHQESKECEEENLQRANFMFAFGFRKELGTGIPDKETTPNPAAKMSL